MPGLVLDHCSLVYVNHKPVYRQLFLSEDWVGRFTDLPSNEFWSGERATTPRSHEDKSLQEGFTGIKALKLLDDHALLSETFREHTSWERLLGESSMHVQQMPRLS